MRDKENVQALSELSIHMVGINFYPLSKRYFSEEHEADAFDSLSEDIQLVGVFVDEEFDIVSEYVESYQLDYVQLHGSESPMYCTAMKELAGVIKVFGVGEDFDFAETKAYNDVDYFLFDTKTNEHGGSGRKFDWTKLNNYTVDIPFLLAGGIAPDDHKEILKINHNKFAGVDLNSKFEISPAVKNIELIKDFIKETST